MKTYTCNRCGSEFDLYGDFDTTCPICFSDDTHDILDENEIGDYDTYAEEEDEEDYSY